VFLGNTKEFFDAYLMAQDAQYGKPHWCGTAAGTANALTVAASPTVTGLSAGLTLEFIAPSANTSQTVTLQADGTTAKNLKDSSGALLQIGDIVANGVYRAQYNGTEYRVVSGLRSAASALVESPLFGFKNRLINGDMRIDQRKNGSSLAFVAGAALEFGVDRWFGHCTGANVTGQRVAGAGNTRFRYRFTGAASVTAINFGQRIEQADCYDMAGQSAVLSVDLANSLLTSVGWAVYYANTADTFGTMASPAKTLIASGTFTVNSTVTRYSTKIAIPAGATTGLEVVLSVGAQTSGTWTIGDAQLEIGSAASLFERVALSEALGRCRRFYRTTRAGSQFGSVVTTGQAVSNVRIVFGGIEFPVPMRAAPAVEVYSCNADQAGYVCAYNALSSSLGLAHAFSSSSQQGIANRVEGNSFSALTPDSFYSFTYDADAELRT
jgi:hypothetical protein